MTGPRPSPSGPLAVRISKLRGHISDSTTQAKNETLRMRRAPSHSRESQRRSTVDFGWLRRFELTRVRRERARRGGTQKDAVACCRRAHLVGVLWVPAGCLPGHYGWTKIWSSLRRRTPACSKAAPTARTRTQHVASASSARPIARSFPPFSLRCTDAHGSLCGNVLQAGRGARGNQRLRASLLFQLHRALGAGARPAHVPDVQTELQ